MPIIAPKFQKKSDYFNYDLSFKLSAIASTEIARSREKVTPFMSLNFSVTSKSTNSRAAY